jgi:hypothetical protein
LVTIKDRQGGAVHRPGLRTREPALKRSACPARLARVGSASCEEADGRLSSPCCRRVEKQRTLSEWLVRRITERGLAGTREVPRRALAADFLRGSAVRQSPLQAAREMRAAAPPSQQTAMAPTTATSYFASRPPPPSHR